VITLEVFGKAEIMGRVAQMLDASPGTSRVRSTDATRPGYRLVSAAVRHHAVDTVIAELRELGVRDDEVTITRVDEVMLSARRADAGVIWEDVIGSAGLNARPVTYFLAFMLVAGVIGCYGVIDENGILIVGAMAVSPDLLPITAIAVGLTSRHPRLAGRALATVSLGMLVAAAVAAILTFAQEQLGLIPSSFDIDSTVLGSLATLSDGTAMIALAAGVAGMLALETRASSAVGVAISVTTIPAACYLGVAAGLGDAGTATGALVLLATNVVMMVVGASGALVAQRLHHRRRDRADHLPAA
jgi:uncharacterized hydrophobic protein (TIGR00271 family)